MTEGIKKEPMQIGSIAKLELNPGDRVVVNIDVGNMPPNKVRDYVADVRAALKDFFPPDTKMLINAVGPNRKALDITVISGPFFGER